MHPPLNNINRDFKRIVETKKLNNIELRISFMRITLKFNEPITTEKAE